MRRLPIDLLGCLLLLGLLGGGRLVSPLWAADEKPPKADNPYLARAGLSRTELVEFIRQMQTKPVSVRGRAGFNEALVDAAVRILADGKEDEPAGVALVTRFDALHELADKGNKEADEQLATLAGDWAGDKRAPVADSAKLYLLERQALDAEKVEPKDLPPILARLKKYCQGHPLDGRHVRMASATVKIINRLPDDAAASAAYAEFGKLFAASENVELARYGRKIEKGPKSGAAKPAAAKDP